MNIDKNPMINLVDSFLKPKTSTATVPIESEVVEIVKSKELISLIAQTNNYVGEKPKREERI